MANMDAVLRYQVGQHETQLKDHESRVKKLELDHARLFVYATLGSALGAVATTIACQLLLK